MQLFRWKMMIGTHSELPFSGSGEIKMRLIEFGAVE